LAITAARKLVLVTVTAWCGTGLGAAALAQERRPTTEGDRAAPALVEEEVVVQGQRRAAVRAEIELAEDAVYERFNAINSDDEFDIECRREAVTGSKMLRRICEPNFWREENANAARETVIALQGGSALSVQHFWATQQYKRRLLADEMHRLATEDGEFRDALQHLESLQQAAGGWRESEAASPSTSPEAAAVEQALIAEGAVVVKVRVGREPWQHVLTRPTFLLADVDGEIRGLGLECDRRREQLEYADGVEWNVPESWGECSLLVDAKRNTAFSLYELD
jgi:hypothetical protein